MLDGLISHGKTVHPITLRRFDNNQIWETSYDNKQWASPSYLYKCYNGYFYDAYKNVSINFIVTVNSGNSQIYFTKQKMMK